MRKTILFIAMSLDGYIADQSGGVDWLKGQSGEEETEDVYSRFVKGVDTVFMGWKTYHQIIMELSPDEWVYKDLTTYVFTHRENDSSERIRFTSEEPSNLLERLRSENGKDIWICGGADLARQLIREDQIDQYYLSVIPVILGSGIRLFAHTEREIKLRLIETRTYNGITDLVYVRR